MVPFSDERISPFRYAINWICGIEKQSQPHEKLTAEELEAREAAMLSIKEDTFWRRFCGINAIVLMTLAIFLCGFFAWSISELHSKKAATHLRFPDWCRDLQPSTTSKRFSLWYYNLNPNHQCLWQSDSCGCHFACLCHSPLSRFTQLPIIVKFLWGPGFHVIVGTRVRALAYSPVTLHVSVVWFWFLLTFIAAISVCCMRWSLSIARMIFYKATHLNKPVFPSWQVSSSHLSLQLVTHDVRLHARCFLVCLTANSSKWLLQACLWL